MAVSEILNALISIYKQLFRVNTLTDAVLFSKYPQTALALDEVLREVGHPLFYKAGLLGYTCCAIMSATQSSYARLQGYVEHLDGNSVARAIACKVRSDSIKKETRKLLMVYMMQYLSNKEFN